MNLDIEYDREHDLAYLHLTDARARGIAVVTVPVGPSLLLDFDREGHLLGIEFLEASVQLPPEALAR